MMLSVLKHTKTPLKFWFLKNYLAPTFREGCANSEEEGIPRVTAEFMYSENSCCLRNSFALQLSNQPLSAYFKLYFICSSSKGRGDTTFCAVFLYSIHIMQKTATYTR